uniref:Uncharacterized protein n=1 Tax=Rhizophora mucronata TaxID=61149 RepID=A0A2P2N2H5_RHIMU
MSSLSQTIDSFSPYHSILIHLLIVSILTFLSCYNLV